jgi:16S rRNA (guanine1516-N2)-methyltransferase
MHSKKSCSTAVFSSIPEDYDRAAALAIKLDLPLVRDDTAAYDFLLFYSAAGLALQKSGRESPGPIMADFKSPAMLYRLKHGGGRRQALARAAGLKKGWQPTVIDATAGLGRDAFVLAFLGCHVHMLERNPVLSALLADAMQRARLTAETAEAVTSRIRLTQADSKDYLHGIKQEEGPDIIYLDPMYPERSKNSLVKKEMRLLRGLAGDDLDADELLAIALDRARNRVMVKRPRLSPFLGNCQPTHQIMGKTSRFDVYLV